MTRDSTDLTFVIAAALQALDGLTVDDAHKRARAILMKAAELGHGGAAYHLHTLDYQIRDDIAARVRAEHNGRNGRWCTINKFLYNKCLASGISA